MPVRLALARARPKIVAVDDERFLNISERLTSLDLRVASLDQNHADVFDGFARPILASYS
jgi:hypothetical protein